MAKKRKKRIVARKRKRTTTERKGYELPLDVPTYMIDGREHFRLERGKYVPTEGAGSVAPLTDKGISLIGDYSDPYSCAIMTQLERQIPMKKNGLLIVSIYDRSGVMIEPWREQIKNGRTINKGNVCVTIDLGEKVYDDHKNCYHFALDLLTTDPCSILSRFGDGTCDVLFAFPPCTDWSGAGTGSVKRKFWEDKFWMRRAMMLVDVARNWATHSKFWMIENPVGNLRKAWRKGNWVFEPYEYAGHAKGKNKTDTEIQQFLNYHTKNTEIWANFPKPPPKYAPFHGKTVPIPAKLKDWAYDIPKIRKPFKFDKPYDPTGKKKYREFPVVKQAVYNLHYPKHPWSLKWTPTKGMGIGREKQKSKLEKHFWRSLLPSGFAQAIYKELHRIKVPTQITEYQSSPMYTAPIPAPSKSIVKNPKIDTVAVAVLDYNKNQWGVFAIEGQQLEIDGQTYFSSVDEIHQLLDKHGLKVLSLGAIQHAYQIAKKVPTSRNPKLRLYKTGETDSRGRDVYRRVGVEPSYSQSKGVLTEEYFVGDVIPVKWIGSQPSVYSPNLNKWTNLNVGKKGSRFRWTDKVWTILGTVIYNYDGELDAFKQNKPSYIGEMYTVDGPYLEGEKKRRGRKSKTAHRARYEVWHDGEPSSRLVDFELVQINPKRKGRNLGYGTSNGGMAKNQLQTIERTARQLNEILYSGDELPDWVLTKVSTAMDRLLSAYNYIQSKLQGMKQNPRVNVSAAIKNAQKVIQEIR